MTYWTLRFGVPNDERGSRTITGDIQTKIGSHLTFLAPWRERNVEQYA